MIALTRSSVITSVAAAGIGALVISNVTPAQEVHSPPSVVHEVRLAASPAPGALLDRFLLNQLQNCAAICPFIVQGLVTGDYAMKSRYFLNTWCSHSFIVRCSRRFANARASGVALATLGC